MIVLILLVALMAPPAASNDDCNSHRSTSWNPMDYVDGPPLAGGVCLNPPTTNNPQEQS